MDNAKRRADFKKKVEGASEEERARVACKSFAQMCKDLKLIPQFTYSEDDEPVIIFVDEEIFVNQMQTEGKDFSQGLGINLFALIVDILGDSKMEQLKANAKNRDEISRLVDDIF